MSTAKPPVASLCSEQNGEPLAGTAKRAEAYALFEWPGGWSRDVLDGGIFGQGLSARLKRALKGKVSLQLIRRPGRAGREVGERHRCYLVWARTGEMELLLLDGPEDLVGLDLGGPERNGGRRVRAPLLLVCTHGRRDVCCAVKGRPLAAELDGAFPDQVWETSHTKGHRFAPAVLIMPWGYSFGRLNAPAARELLSRAQRGSFFLPANRGSGLYGPRGQVAELHVARALLDSGEDLAYGELTVQEAPDGLVTVYHRDGRVWEVSLVRREVEGVVASCGSAPKATGVWAVDSGVHEKPV